MADNHAALLKPPPEREWLQLRHRDSLELDDKRMLDITKITPLQLFL